MNDWIIKSSIPVECDVLNESLQFPSRNIYCVGRNYRDHAIEMGGDPEREKPFFFQKTSDILVKNGSELLYPKDTSDLQYEVELVVAISKDAFKVGLHEAKNKVFECGYKKNLNNNSKVFKKNLFFLQFHTEGISFNKNMELLAKGILYDVDSFKIKNKNIYGFQFHPEVTAQTIKRWHDIVKIKYPYIDNLNKIMKDFKKYQFQNYNWFQEFLLKLLK